MNWYKESQYNYYSYKYSWDWKKFLLPIMIPLIPMLVYLGISPQDANKIAEKHNNNPTAIKQELQQMVRENEIPPVKRNLPYVSPEKTIKEEKPGVINQTSANNINIADYIRKNEGAEPKAYKDSEGNWTIGVGHLIQKGEEYLLNKTLNDKEINQLFAQDLEEHINRTKRIFPKFDQYPQDIQAALTDSVYRGDMGPNTRKLINSGNWKAAADEYINHSGYRASKAGEKGRGIYKRMDRNRAQMLGYARELGQI